jgi:hypothetical protein
LVLRLGTTCYKPIESYFYLQFFVPSELSSDQSSHTWIRWKWLVSINGSYPMFGPRLRLRLAPHSKESSKNFNSGYYKALSIRKFVLMMVREKNSFELKSLHELKISYVGVMILNQSEIPCWWRKHPRIPIWCAKVSRNKNNIHLSLDKISKTKL